MYEERKRIFHSESSNRKINIDNRVNDFRNFLWVGEQPNSMQIFYDSFDEHLTFTFE